jgi:hypothetical protein
MIVFEFNRVEPNPSVNHKSLPPDTQFSWTLYNFLLVLSGLKTCNHSSRISARRYTIFCLIPPSLLITIHSYLLLKRTGM